MYKHVFGPVPSRRLGISLGVDLVVSKSCNLNCIFCECGATKKIQLERKRFKDMNEILEEIVKSIKKYAKELGVEDTKFFLQKIEEDIKNNFEKKSFESLKPKEEKK